MLTTHLARSPDGELIYEDIRLADVARHFGTPCYVYSRATIVENFRAYQAAFVASKPMICYAVKANSTLSVLALLASEGAGFDIVSGGELQRVIAAGGDPGKVIFSGVGKRHDEISLALSHNIFCFNVESEAELYRVNEVAIADGKRARITFRINPDVDAKTHPYISTGLKSNKFGVAHADAVRLYTLAANMKGIEVHGIECHIGSQITELSPYVDALRRLLSLVDELSARNIQLHHIDLGGGRAINYQADEIVAMSEFAQAVEREIAGRHLQLLLEPGRSIVGDAGLLLTKIEYLKPGETKNFALVDAAMNDLIRPTLYDAWHPVEPLLTRPGVATIYDIVGPVCESGDWLAKERALVVEQGDLLAVLCAGAYGMTMASNYNSRSRPAEVMVDGDEAHLIRERERFEDLVAHERIVI
jgi:diaminopimelate decarboxylase